MNDEEKADEIEGRRYPRRPIVGVGVVVVRGDRVLLIRRGKPPRQGQWSLPGGAQELGRACTERCAARAGGASRRAAVGIRR